MVLCAKCHTYNSCVTHIRFVRYCLSDIGLSDDIVCPTAYIRSWWYCLVRYSVVGMPGMVWYGWYAWYAAFSLMHIKYKYGSRDRDDFGDFFLPSSNSLKIALVTCCCRGNCQNSETSAMSGGFSTKGQCWSGLPWKWF